MKLLYTAAAAAIALVMLGANADAWEGTDTDTGGTVEIEQGSLVRSGRDIEIYDQEAGEYHDATVESINRTGSTVEIQIYDGNSGEDRTLQFDDNDQ